MEKTIMIDVMKSGYFFVNDRLNFCRWLLLLHYRYLDRTDRRIKIDIFEVVCDTITLIIAGAKSEPARRKAGKLRSAKLYVNFFKLPVHTVRSSKAVLGSTLPVRNSRRKCKNNLSNRPEYQ
jgi:hypothetical protein